MSEAEMRGVAAIILAAGFAVSGVIVALIFLSDFGESMAVLRGERKGLKPCRACSKDFPGMLSTYMPEHKQNYLQPCQVCKGTTFVKLPPPPAREL